MRVLPAPALRSGDDPLEASSREGQFRGGLGASRQLYTVFPTSLPEFSLNHPCGGLEIAVTWPQAGWMVDLVRGVKGFVRGVKGSTQSLVGNLSGWTKASKPLKTVWPYQGFINLKDLTTNLIISEFIENHPK